MKKSKNNKLIIGLISTVVILVTLLAVLNILRDSALHVIGLSEMEEILNDDSGTGTFVYIGRPTCPFCNEFEPILEGALQSLGQELAYFETDLADLENRTRRSEIQDQLGVTGVPVIVYIVNGETVASLNGLQQQEAVLEFFETNGGLR